MYSAKQSDAPTHERGITLAQLNALSEHIQTELKLQQQQGSPLWDHFREMEILWENINMHNVNHYFVKPMTLCAECSFVSLVATQPQIPSWFVSHSWNAPFKETIELLNYHAEARELCIDTVYWICTFANNQHNLDELARDIMDTPFALAILSEDCHGTVALVDTKLSIFSRAWCIFENYLSTTVVKETKPDFRYDIAAMIPPESQTFNNGHVPSKPTVRLDQGGGNMEERVSGDPILGTFPLSVAAKGVTIDIAKAEASVESDRLAILNRIAGTTDDPPVAHENYDKLNTAARAMFAGNAAYWFAVGSNIPALESVLAEFPEVVNFQVTDGATAALACSYFNCRESLELLIRHGADLRIPRYDGATCWSMAQNKPEILELLGKKHD